MDLECLARELVLYSKSNEEPVCRGDKIDGLQSARDRGKETC